MLIGMALSFAFFAALSVTGGNWVVKANQYGRVIALVIFTILGLTLLFPKLGDRVMQPFVNLGGALQKKADAGSGLGSSLLLGASMGLLWAPCAGPILGLVLAGAAVSGTQSQTLGLLFVFAMGAATSLAVAILAGGKLLQSLKKGLGAEEWIKRGIGVIVLSTVVSIALGFDTKILSKISYLNTNRLETNLVSKLSKSETQENETLPSLEGATEWLNSPPLTKESLKGKVVLIDFWTYSCINCLRSLPYVKAWNEKYKDQGLVVIGIHAPEFAFEKDIPNVKKAVTDLGITYPVAIDNDEVLWKAFKNQYWPAHYFVDINGKIRFQHAGEGSYDEAEKIIQALLNEKNPGKTGALPATLKDSEPVQGEGIQAPRSLTKNLSPETYLGYGSEEGFASSPEMNRDENERYQIPNPLKINTWGLKGEWNIAGQKITLVHSPGSIRYRFHARDVHLVLGHSGSKSIPFRVTLDGKPPTKNHGVDTDAGGKGVIDGHRLYQLIRKKAGDAEQTIEIEFLEPGVEAYAFTFG